MYVSVMSSEVIQTGLCVCVCVLLRERERERAVVSPWENAAGIKVVLDPEQRCLLS